jgi:hypothetical protein
MAVYVTEDNKSYVALDLSIEKSKVLTLANKYFKTTKDRLVSTYGWVKNDTLYFEEKRGAKKVWLVSRKPKKS